LRLDHERLVGSNLKLFLLPVPKKSGWVRVRFDCVPYAPPMLS